MLFILYVFIADIVHDLLTTRLRLVPIISTHNHVILLFRDTSLNGQSNVLYDVFFFFFLACVYTYVNSIRDIAFVIVFFFIHITRYCPLL